MTGLLRVVTVALVVGVICFCSPQNAAAMEEDAGESGESGEPGERIAEVPLYYLQLQNYCAQKSEVENSDQPKLLEYIIRQGDNLYDIAARFGTDVNTLVCLNDIVNPHLIYPGAVLEVLTTVGSVHDVKEGDTIASIAKLYGVEKEVILEANSLGSLNDLERGSRVIVPGGIGSRGEQLLYFSWPLQGRITSGYGWRNGKFHPAIDIAAPLGTPIQASAGGRVTHAAYLGTYGLMVEIDHGSGYVTRYAHASKLSVSVGTMVTRGQVVGYVGVTGNSTGPHVHFELHYNNQRLNPLQYLK